MRRRRRRHQGEPNGSGSALHRQQLFTTEGTEGTEEAVPLCPPCPLWFYLFRAGAMNFFAWLPETSPASRPAPPSRSASTGSVGRPRATPHLPSRRVSRKEGF